jgi:hypothetical protein
MSDVALDNFCKDARQSLNFGQGEGILELTCRWKTPLAADILNAFFWEFHDHVVSYETVNSTQNLALLKRLAGEYKVREQAIEKKIIAYKQRHVPDPPADADATSNQYVTMLSGLEEMKLSLQTAQARRDSLAKQLAGIPPKIVASQVFGNYMDNPLYQAAQKKVADAQSNVDTLKARYQDQHPKVKEAQAALDLAQGELKKAEKVAKSTRVPTSTQEVVNPDYSRLVSVINQADAELNGLRARYALQEKQAEAEKQRALTAPPKNYEYKWLTDEYGIIGTIRNNLENRQHIAELTQEQDLQRSSAETAMIVRPAAEPEAAGGRSMLLYAAGPILGLIIAFAFSLVAETLDHSLRTPIEVERHLGKPVLAVLPRMDPPRPSRRQLGTADRGHPTLPPA